MRTVATRSLVILLSIALMQSGLLTCCPAVPNSNTSQQQPCHGAPTTPHSCCLSVHVQQATAPQSLTNWEKVLSAVDHLQTSSDVWTVASSATERLDGMARNGPRPSKDLFVQFHVFLI